MAEITNENRAINLNMNKSLTTVVKSYTNTGQHAYRHSQNNQPNSFKIMFNKVDRPFLLASFLSLLASVFLWFLVNRDYGVFVGLWVPSILILWVGVRLVLMANLNNQSKRD